MITRRPGRRIGARTIGTLSGLTLFVAVAAGVASADTARAADWCQGHPTDPSYGCVHQLDQDTLTVCDEDADGHGAFALVYLVAEDSYRTSPYAPDARLTGCTTVRYPGPVTQLSVCVQDEGCGGFRSVP